MTAGNAALEKMEGYLRVLRESLRGLPKEDADDIVAELRSHLIDSGAIQADPAAEGSADEAAAMEAALQRLGPPRELAARYVLDSVVRRAARDRTPWAMLESAYRWAAVSTKGLITLFLCLTGYGLSIPFVLAAILKPFRPDRVGLWKLSGSPETYSLRLGFGSPVPGTELLGGWIVPLGLLAGVGLFLLTTHFGLWSLRRFSAGPPAARC
jgi:uncharacterized membrane protein